MDSVLPKVQSTSSIKPLELFFPHRTSKQIVNRLLKQNCQLDAKKKGCALLKMAFSTTSVQAREEGEVLEVLNLVKV